VAVSPEEIGLCGCWQVLAIERATIHLAQERQNGSTPNPTPTVQVGYYVTSLSDNQASHEELLKIVGDHWAAIENGSHLRRDVTFGEDSCQVGKGGGAQVLSALRNLALGLFELELAGRRTQTQQFKSWCRQMTAANALRLLRR
jgi:predicted transposase YbfD/YdcC